MVQLTVKLDFEDFPEVHTCRGANRSPPIQVGGLLPDIKSLAILATASPREVASRVAWILWNPPVVSLIPGGFPAEGVTESPSSCCAGHKRFWQHRLPGPLPGARGG